MTDNKNTILAIVLSALVLLGWQYFFAAPQEKSRQEQLQAAAAEAERDRAGANSARSRHRRRRQAPRKCPARPGAGGGRADRPARRRLQRAARCDRDRQRAGLDRAQGRTH